MTEGSWRLSVTRRFLTGSGETGDRNVLRPAGAGAILLWATLASLTALRGDIPPFQTTAIVFAIGGMRRDAGSSAREDACALCGRRRPR